MEKIKLNKLFFYISRQEIVTVKTVVVFTQFDYTHPRSHTNTLFVLSLLEKDHRM